MEITKVKAKRLLIVVIICLFVFDLVGFGSFIRQADKGTDYVSSETLDNLE